MRASLLRVFTLLICSAVFVAINVWFVRWSLSDSGNPPDKSRAVVYDIGHANAHEKGARGAKVWFEQIRVFYIPSIGIPILWVVWNVY